MINLFKKITLIGLFAISTIAMANNYASHVHGHAEMTIAVENNNVDLKLIAPAESLLGFEHKAITPEEISKVIAMKEHLINHANVILFNGGQCHIKNVNVNTNDILRYDQQDHAQEYMYSHAEITLKYQYNCLKANDISSAKIQLFKHFSALEKVEVIWLTYAKQSSIKLDANTTEINFQ